MHFSIILHLLALSSATKIIAIPVPPPSGNSQHIQWSENLKTPTYQWRDFEASWTKFKREAGKILTSRDEVLDYELTGIAEDMSWEMDRIARIMMGKDSATFKDPGAIKIATKQCNDVMAQVKVLLHTVKYPAKVQVGERENKINAIRQSLEGEYWRHDKPPASGHQGVAQVEKPKAEASQGAQPKDSEPAWSWDRFEQCWMDIKVKAQNILTQRLTWSNRELLDAAEGMRKEMISIKIMAAVADKFKDPSAIRTAGEQIETFFAAVKNAREVLTDTKSKGLDKDVARWKVEATISSLLKKDYRGKNAKP